MSVVLLLLPSLSVNGHRRTITRTYCCRRLGLGEAAARAPHRGGMARGIETGWGSWAVLALLLVSSSVVLVLQWNEVRDHYALSVRCYRIVVVMLHLQSNEHCIPSHRLSGKSSGHCNAVAVEGRLVGGQTPRIPRREPGALGRSERTTSIGASESDQACLFAGFALSVSHTYDIVVRTQRARRVTTMS